jgi:polynucleotide 5'-kinase involved in rRNA processing
VPIPAISPVLERRAEKAKIRDERKKIRDEKPERFLSLPGPGREFK